MSQQLEIALDYLRAGIAVVPVRLDGSKRPSLEGWKEFQNRFPSEDEVSRWFSRPAGIAFVCGRISHGIEVIDFDEDADENFPRWHEQLTPDIRGKLCVVETGGLGRHVIYRCKEIGPGQKIAMRDKETLIETRGEGNIIVTVGSPLEVHESRSPYVQTHGIELPTIPIMSPDERRAMWAAARTFDQRDKAEVIEPYVKLRMPKPQARPADSSTPWDDFDLRADWQDILGPAGWQSRDGRHWTRPGKSFGTSASVVIAKNGCEVLTVFSGNAGELSPATGSHRTLGKFEAFKILFHGGDKSAAAKAIRRLGYGK